VVDSAELAVTFYRLHFAINKRADAKQISSSGDPSPFVLQRLLFNLLLPCGREDSTSIGFLPAEM
jgi:hypothetical protein